MSDETTRNALDPAIRALVEAIDAWAERNDPRQPQRRTKYRRGKNKRARHR